MVWRVALIIGAVVAIACAGIAIYADGQPAEARCNERRDLQPGDQGYVDPTGLDSESAEFADFVNRGAGPCVGYDDAPSPILRSGTTTWWWFGAAAAAVLTAVSIPLLRRPRP
jgi:hypothetical protein